ncbi:hypothetical protein EJ06DRAFT_397406 [Trichodelitschia bisporula]|uniref:Uncharacterized protein n=1 Tax=Trichodelitschia bisporula TaxID=703511 RepID=A0A6G1HX43_9PEZI|nr:hypothetical protein EJ06DRAFT_397406 [Trichodelitschia bisporula]
MGFKAVREGWGTERAVLIQSLSLSLARLRCFSSGVNLSAHGSIAFAGALKTGLLCLVRSWSPLLRVLRSGAHIDDTLPPTTRHLISYTSPAERLYTLRRPTSTPHQPPRTPHTFTTPRLTTPQNVLPPLHPLPRLPAHTRLRRAAHTSVPESREPDACPFLSALRHTTSHEEGTLSGGGGDSQWRNRGGYVGEWVGS